MFALVSLPLVTFLLFDLSFTFYFMFHCTFHWFTCAHSLSLSLLHLCASLPIQLTAMHPDTLPSNVHGAHSSRSNSSTELREALSSIRPDTSSSSSTGKEYRSKEAPGSQEKQQQHLQLFAILLLSFTFAPHAIAY